jgi:glycosyltransferase involved in cell wall biosynthesis
VTRSPSAERPGRSRRILLAAYYFPPDAAVGALRLARFARALPDFGWEPLVLTVRDEYRDQGFDGTRVKGLENITIVRTGVLPRIGRRLRPAFSRLFRRRNGAPTSTESRAVATASRDGRERAAQRFKRWIISLAVLLPDEKKRWAIPAAFEAVKLIRRRKIEYVMTSGPPFSAHFIGLVAKVFTGARWIADFRDPWIDLLPERFPHTRSTVSDFLEGCMEASVARVADTVVVTTPRMQAAIRARYPRIAPDRFVCITNGIDSAAFQACGARGKYDRLTITYTGNLYFDRTPEPLFEAVSRLLQDRRIGAQDIRIKLVGQSRSCNGADTKAMADGYGLRDIVEVLDPVPYPEAVRMMQRSHLVLVLAPRRHQLVVPAKLYDYLGSGSTILAIAEPGATADLIEETASGRCFSETDVAGLRRYLEELIEGERFRTIGNAPESFSRYNLRQLTGRLVAAMEQAGARCADQIAVQG